MPKLYNFMTWWNTFSNHFNLFHHTTFFFLFNVQKNVSFHDVTSKMTCSFQGRRVAILATRWNSVIHSTSCFFNGTFCVIFRFTLDFYLLYAFDCTYYPSPVLKIVVHWGLGQVWFLESSVFEWRICCFSSRSVGLEVWSLYLIPGISRILTCSGPLFLVDLCGLVHFGSWPVIRPVLIRRIFGLARNLVGTSFGVCIGARVEWCSASFCVVSKHWQRSLPANCVYGCQWWSHSGDLGSYWFSFKG